jgi:signal transduction histidine kinase
VRPGRSLRTRLAWSASAVVALWLIALTVGANLLLAGVLGREADGVLRARAEATAATVQPGPGGRVAIREVRDDQALDAGTWIFAADGTTLERPPGSSSTLDRLAADLAGRGVGSAETGLAAPVRLLAQPVREGGRLLATVVTSTSLAPYEQVQRLALVGSAALAVGLLLVVHLVLRASVARALRPVQEMSAQAGRWSAEDVDRRFGAAPRSAELDDLAHTLDGLLDRLAAVLRRERQLSDDLSHELRTPLARIQAEVDLLGSRPRSRAERADALATIDEAAGSMRVIIETLMSAARASAGAPAGRCTPRAVLVPLAARTGVRRPDVELRVEVPEQLTVGLDGALLERAVAPVLENAVRHAAGRVTITAETAPPGVRLRICDDGPGVPVDAHGLVFEPGWRGDPLDGHDGAGLGLPLARRLVAAAGGELRVEETAGGAVFVLDLPRG